MSLRFSKIQRLSKPYEIRRVLAEARRVNAGGFIIKWKLRGDLTSKSRICVTVRKKEVRLAVHRNRIRRLVKEFFRLHAGEFARPVDMVVQARNYKLLNYKELERNFITSLKNTGILP